MENNTSSSSESDCEGQYVPSIIPEFLERKHIKSLVCELLFIIAHEGDDDGVFRGQKLTSKKAKKIILNLRELMHPEFIEFCEQYFTGNEETQMGKLVCL